ncbi:RhoGAP domain-containing protein [Colletotrichum orchidophilum]|uniref:RhoGAP domain-containing protein n=1 Tax=Colletotrichum orchidophilum TaxID=1209926 RepID=A0A1G4B5R8_9PEZI|nr:RhoGAP domain-containing protein [Colletotrichum orchidophilum]OHE96751.1 RhoGAP domain-containing protein [Colletotrichum orchidophilum]
MFPIAPRVAIIRHPTFDILLLKLKQYQRPQCSRLSTFGQRFHFFFVMQPYDNDPSLSSAVSRDLETGTLESQTISTAPTSTAAPQLPIVASIPSSRVNLQPLASSNTLPALIVGEGRRSRALPSSATWASSVGDLAMLSDTDEIQDRRRFVQEYNRLAKRHGIRALAVDEFEGGVVVPSTPFNVIGTFAYFARITPRSPSQAKRPVTRGVFRIPGSLRVVNAIFDYYCYEKPGEEITSTIRCPTLPSHINAGAQDVASAFKKLLSVLPGGILGSLPLFDALVAIHSQLRGEPELSRTKETKLRARLIAMAIGTIKSHFRRELICAVIGLLSLIGRAAETAAREDEQGRPLPTSDLMGYAALGIVFGPLLVGDLLDSYAMKLANPSSGLLLFPLTPPRLKMERQRKDTAQNDKGPMSVDKIHVANDITEMLISNWREVVRNMKSLSSFRESNEDLESTSRRRFLRSSNSDSLAVGLPRGWKSKHSSPRSSTSRQRSQSPTTPTPASTEESMADDRSLRESKLASDMKDASLRTQALEKGSPVRSKNTPQPSCSNAIKSHKTPQEGLIRSSGDIEKDQTSVEMDRRLGSRRAQRSIESPRVSDEVMPGRNSSKASSKPLPGYTRSEKRVWPSRHTSPDAMSPYTPTPSNNVFITGPTSEHVPYVETGGREIDSGARCTGSILDESLLAGANHRSNSFDGSRLGGKKPDEDIPINSFKAAERSIHGRGYCTTLPSIKFETCHDAGAPFWWELWQFNAITWICLETSRIDAHGGALHLGRPSLSQLRRTPDTSRHEKSLPNITARDDDRNLPNLGTMTKPAQQPPIAQHVIFSRPPSTLSVLQPSEDVVPVRAGSPGNNSMLHAQIRNLRRQLDVKNEESAFLRRQLETRDNLDIGTLSEQLRVAKRECAMWKSRAEAAEKRVSVLEHFTRRLKGIKGGDAQNDTDGTLQSEGESTETVATEDGEIVAERIRRAMRGMDGTRSSDGRAAAWWNDNRHGSGARHSGGLGGHHWPKITEEALLQVWEAAQELLLDDGN